MSKTYKITKSFTFEGKRYYVHADTEEEAIEKRALRKKELQDQKRQLFGGSMTVLAWSEICFAEYKTNVAKYTLENQKYKANKWILSRIGHMRVKDVRPLHCQKIMNSMDGMAADTIRKVKQLMTWMFQKAVENAMINENPAKYLTIPKAGKSTRRAITAAEREAIVTVAEQNPRYVYFLTMLYCGCRPSEAAELKGMDVQEVDGESMLHIRGTKTVAADRYVPIPDTLSAVLPKVLPFDCLFTTTDGKPLQRGNRQALWRSFRRQLNIAMGCQVYRNKLVPPYPVAPDLTPYCLRHTYCTDLQKVGVDVRTAQYLMGHSDIRMTANIYTHTDTETLLKVAEKMRGVAPTVAPMPETVEI